MTRKIAVLMVICVYSISLLFIPNGNSAQTTKIEYNWSENQYTFHFTRNWEQVSDIINYSGSYHDQFSTNIGEYNETEDSWVNEQRIITYASNYTYYSNTTRTGGCNLDLIFTIYQVNINYGDIVKLMWVALKSGTIQMEYDMNSYFKEYSYYEDFQEDIESKFTKYDFSTSEKIDEWTENSQNIGIREMNPDPIEYSEYNLYNFEISMPLILTMQIFTTENKDKIAWAEEICDYIIYQDRDSDGIYSAGETSNPSQSGFSLYQSDEYCGVIYPMAAWGTYFYDYNGYNTSYTVNFPCDKSVNEIASNIKFTPPSLTDNIVSWNIEYPQFPMDIRVTDFENGNYYFTRPNATFSNVSPQDFAYGFNYNITETQANLAYTIGLSKVSNSTLYSKLQGYGLSLPHYNYFLSSFDITEVDSKDLTIPDDLFIFESNNTIVAEIDLLSPLKKNYTLYDYPKLGADTEIESRGGSLHRLLMRDQELSVNPTNPFINLIYSVSDVVATDRSFIVVDDMYRVETHNFPIWNGEKLWHDPTLRIHHHGAPGANDINPYNPTTIPGMDVCLMIMSSVVVVMVYLIKSQSKSKNFFSNNKNV